MLLWWLSTIRNIAPAHLRRREAPYRMTRRVDKMTGDTPWRRLLPESPVTNRLRSRKPYYNNIENNIVDVWRSYWTEEMPAGGSLVDEPIIPLPGLKGVSRRIWTAANRIRSRLAMTGQTLQRWGMTESPECPSCGHHTQDVEYLVVECPVALVAKPW